MGFPFRDTTPEEQQRLSFDGLIRYVRDYIYPYSPYYRRLMREHAIDPGSLRTYDDFRRIPLTTKEDLVAHEADFTLRPGYPGEDSSRDVEPLRSEIWESYRQAAQQPAFRDVFGLRPESERIREQFLREWQPIHFQLSGGTSGRSAMTGYTYRDLTLQFTRSGAWWYALPLNLGMEDKWLNLCPAAPHLAIYASLILPLLNAQPNFNTFGGKVMPTERQVQLAAAGDYSVLATIPSYLVHWLRTARSMQQRGLIGPLSKFRAAVCFGEPMTDSYRDILHGLFSAVGSPSVAVLEGMSSTELRTVGFYECAEGSKLHLDPEYFFFEILDPVTREPVPWGEPGVFVWSHIDWRGTAILRYWTGDYAEGGIRWGQCPSCGLVIPRLITPLRRVERDFTKVRGSRVEFLVLEDAVRGVKGVQTFQIVISKDDPTDPFSRDLLEVFVAPHEGVDRESLADSISQSVRSQTEVTPNRVVFESAEELEARLFAKKLKAEWIVDRRPAI